MHVLDAEQLAELRRERDRVRMRLIELELAIAAAISTAPNDVRAVTDAAEPGD
jgi:hypothetical protein